MMESSYNSLCLVPENCTNTRPYPKVLVSSRYFPNSIRHHPAMELLCKNCSAEPSLMGWFREAEGLGEIKFAFEGVEGFDGRGSRRQIGVGIG
jgi:hypothetical protein